MTDDFSALKVGDTVLIDGDNTRIAKISKVTQTQIQTQISEFVLLKFNRVTGYQISGDRWHPAHLRFATPESLEAVRKERRNDFLRRTISQTQWGKVSTEKMEMIYQILNPKEQ